ncbi:MAG: nuclear transport factor 2 family protein [Pseudomonadota bacterium]
MRTSFSPFSPFSLHRLCAVLCLVLAVAATAARAAEPPLVVAHRMVNAWNALDVDAITELFAEDGRFQSMMNADALVGRDAIRAHLAGLLDGATYLELKLQNVAEANGVVFLERVDEFTYKGKDGRVPAVAVLVISDGHVAEWREYYDRPSLLREMGLAEGEH